MRYSLEDNRIGYKLAYESLTRTNVELPVVRMKGLPPVELRQMEVWWWDGDVVRHAELTNYGNTPDLIAELNELRVDRLTMCYRWSYFIEEEP